jgi:hypothetical protein
MLTAANWALYIERDGTESVRREFQTKPEAKQAALEHCVRSRAKVKRFFPQPKLDWHGNGWRRMARPAQRVDIHHSPKAIVKMSSQTDSGTFCSYIVLAYD